jgi:DNA-binding response OmpR family regulator
MPLPPVPYVLIAHRRPPVQRMLRTNLEADAIAVGSVATASEAVTALEGSPVAAVIVDADLLRETVPDGLALRARLATGSPPALVVSWDPCDRLLARELGHAPFLSRPDDIDRMLETVHGLVEPLMELRCG